MKIRQGFVSNSSSSSFVVLLPDKFDASKIKEDTVREAVENIIAGDTIYEYDNYDLFNAVVEALGNNIIATIEGGPEAGQILQADSKKVRKVINEG